MSGRDEVVRDWVIAPTSDAALTLQNADAGDGSDGGSPLMMTRPFRRVPTRIALPRNHVDTADTHPYFPASGNTCKHFDAYMQSAMHDIQSEGGVTKVH
jgi:hypothetical protein